MKKFSKTIIFFKINYYLLLQNSKPFSSYRVTSILKWLIFKAFRYLTLKITSFFAKWS
jgi:hypothetical protein